MQVFRVTSRIILEKNVFKIGENFQLSTLLLSPRAPPATRQPRTSNTTLGTYMTHQTFFNFGIKSVLFNKIDTFQENNSIQVLIQRKVSALCLVQEGSFSFNVRIEFERIYFSLCSVDTEVITKTGAKFTLCNWIQNMQIENGI